MGLDKNFPRQPFTVIDPDVRWYPGSDIGEKGREKLLPPLVNKIRKEVDEWRNADYPNISEVTKSLLTYWFKTEHPMRPPHLFRVRPHALMTTSTSTCSMVTLNSKTPWWKLIT